MTGQAKTTGFGTPQTNLVTRNKHVQFDELTPLCKIQREEKIRRGPGRPRKASAEQVGGVDFSD